MTYQIVQNVDGEFVITNPTDIYAWAEVAGIEITGHNSNPHQREELQGHPKLKGFCGPMWNGNGVIRYEDRRTYEIMSA